MTMKPRALFVAANADEYGSDRMLMLTIDAVHDLLEPVVLLPRRGPLVDRLRAADVRTVVGSDYALRRSCLSARAIGPLLTRNVAAARRIAAIHRERSISVIYSNTQTVLVGALMARLLRVAHLWHVHEIVHDPAFVARPLAQLVAGSGGGVVACSQSVKDSLTHFAPRIARRTEVVLNGIDLPPEAAPPRAREARDDVVRLGCVARIHPRKGQELLLRAMALLVEQNPHIGKTLELHLFGAPFAGHEHVVDDLEKIAGDLGLSDRLQFHGFVSDPSAIYPHIDVLVCPSTESESFGLVCVEALSFGRPVIAPREGGPAEIIESERTGILFEPRSVASLADAIERVVIAPGVARRLAVDGGLDVRARFAASRYRADIRAVVARACGLHA
jgi:glycosyltransferase involved in cell wall biosynthesis